MSAAYDLLAVANARCARLDDRQQAINIRKAEKQPARGRSRLTVEQRLASRKRRRQWGGDGSLPSSIRSHYTEGKRAVLAVVADTIMLHGVCTLAVSTMARRAGVSESTVHAAIREVQENGHAEVQQRRLSGMRNDTNVINITSPEWLDWLAKRPKRLIAIGCKSIFSPEGVRQISAPKGDVLSLSWLGAERRFGVAKPPVASRVQPREGPPVGSFRGARRIRRGGAPKLSSGGVRP